MKNFSLNAEIKDVIQKRRRSRLLFLSFFLVVLLLNIFLENIKTKLNIEEENHNSIFEEMRDNNYVDVLNSKDILNAKLVERNLFILEKLEFDDVVFSKEGMVLYYSKDISKDIAILRENYKFVQIKSVDSNGVEIDVLF